MKLLQELDAFAQTKGGCGVILIVVFLVIGIVGGMELRAGL